MAEEFESNGRRYRVDLSLDNVTRIERALDAPIRDLIDRLFKGFTWALVEFGTRAVSVADESASGGWRPLALNECAGLAATPEAVESLANAVRAEADRVGNAIGATAAPATESQPESPGAPQDAGSTTPDSGASRGKRSTRS